MSETRTVLEWSQWATWYRYSLPVLAELERDGGCKFVTLIYRLQASDRAIRQALDHLMDLGWVGKNPGYGHPSRPEYILTGHPEARSITAKKIWDSIEPKDLALDRWPIPLVFAAAQGARRFSEFQTALELISPRALAQGLKRLLEAGYLARIVSDGFPPTTEYELTSLGTELAQLALDDV